ncbi:MAG: hypothetical protein ACOVNU_09270 [Candidatus Kapaibacteriota bacterium]
MEKDNSLNIEVNVKSTNLISLIGEASKNKTKKIRVEFYPPYNEKEHSNLSEKLKNSLKKSKVEIFDVITDGNDILQLIKEKKERCVKSIKWHDTKMSDGGYMAKGGEISNAQLNALTILSKPNWYLSDYRGDVYLIKKEKDGWGERKELSIKTARSLVEREYVEKKSSMGFWTNIHIWYKITQKGKDAISPKMSDGGMMEKIYYSYEDFVNDNIGCKKYVVVYGSGGSGQPLGGATKESIEQQFKGLIYHEFMDSEFYYNYASNDIKEEYKSFIKEFYNSLLESPKKFASFWKNNMTKSKDYDSLYELKNKYENIVENYNYSTGSKRIDTKSKYVLAIKNSIGKIKYEPIEKPESYQSYIFSEYKNKMSNKLKEEYINYRKKYAGEDIKLKDGGYMAKGGKLKEGDKFGEYSVTYYEPIRYDNLGGTLGGLVKLVNQEDFDVILIQYDNNLRGGEWFVSKNRIRYIGKNPHEVISKLNLNRMSNGGFMEDGGLTSANKFKAKVIHNENRFEYYENDNLISPTSSQKFYWDMFGFPKGVERKEELFVTEIDEISGKTKKEVYSIYENNLKEGKYQYINNINELFLVFDKKMSDGGYMAKGGVTFSDKVDAVKSSLLKRKKVSPSVQKDYGKTYSPKEAEDSAKRIVGSQVAKYKRK